MAQKLTFTFLEKMMPVQTPAKLIALALFEIVIGIIVALIVAHIVSPDRTTVQAVPFPILKEYTYFRNRNTQRGDYSGMRQGPDLPMEGL